MNMLSIRWRLTLWYGVVLALVLFIFGGAVYLMMRHCAHRKDWGGAVDGIGRG